MGRQVQLHLLPSDLKRLLQFAQERDPVIVTSRNSDQASVEPHRDPTATDEVLVLWNTHLLPQLKRKYVQRAPGSSYFRIDDSCPTLEVVPSRLTTWGARPALIQGRMYGLFDSYTVQYEKWFNAVARWIRKNFIRNPTGHFPSYVGPEAMVWFQQGGVFLPTFEPPETAEWTAIIEDQHSRRREIS
jgi:hypothetical protein